MALQQVATAAPAKPAVSDPGVQAPPKQRGGTAEGLDPRAKTSATATKLKSPASKPIRPKGAVPDQLLLPKPKPAKKFTQQRLKNVKTREVKATTKGTKTRTVEIAAARQITADGDDTTVTSGAVANRSSENNLRLGREAAGRVSAAYLHFNLGSLGNQYINGARLNLWTIESGSCTPTPVDVYAVAAPWAGSTLTRWPGAALGQHLGQESSAGGLPACPAKLTGVHLNPDAVTDWTHGTPFHGLSARAANEGIAASFKRYGSANAPTENARPFLDITYSAQGAKYAIDEVLLPTANRTGELKVTVRNRGAVTWSPGSATKFGFTVKRKNGEAQQTSPRFDIPGTVGPGGAIQLAVPIQPMDPGEYDVYVTMYDNGADFATAYGVPYGSFPLRVVNVPPSVFYEQPGSGAQVDSITPTLYAEAKDDDNWPNKGFTYKFRLCAGTPEAPTNCVESGWTGRTWTPPAGRLAWSKTYWWWVQANDTVDEGPWTDPPLALVTTVPQPAITSHLGGVNVGTEAPGLDPQVGNYSAATTDARVDTVGPDLTITRTYNSLDPRTDTAFGNGWASRLDTRLVEDADNSGNVVVTLPNGREVRFGKNPDRTYAPPRGVNATLVYSTTSGEFTLRDSTGTTYVFNPWGKLFRIVDPEGLVEELKYDASNESGKPTELVNLTSKRRLTLTWENGRVTKVKTDAPAPGQAPLEWTYTYDGPRLATACQPGLAPNCAKYTYQAASHYPTVVQDDNPRGYWRFGEDNQATGAVSKTARKPDADKGTYQGVALGGAGALVGTADKAAAFDGQASRVTLPAKLTSPTMAVAFELWFKTTSGGVLASYADKPFGTTANKSAPLLYVGQDGLLRGGFWTSKPGEGRQLASADPVNDGQWHHAVISGFVNTQTLYVDGVPQGTLTGVIDHDELEYLMIGTGDSRKWPSGNDGDFYFAGLIDEVATYQHALGAPAVQSHFAAGKRADVLVKTTLPQDDRVAMTVTYDDVNDRVATMTDKDGRTWRLDVPVRNEADRKVTLRGPYPDVVYLFDADNGGRMKSLTRNGYTRVWEYNEAGFLRKLTNENNNATTYTTDERGNILSSTSCRQANSCQTTYATYFLNQSDALDPRNDRKLTDSDARSSGPNDTAYRTTYGYDALGRMISTKHPAPKGATAPTETWTYATGTEDADGGGTVPRGLLIKEVGKRATTETTYGYRSNGDLAEKREPTGLRSRYDYDAIGRKTAVTTMSATGAVFGSVTYTYTPRSQLQSATMSAVTNALSGVRHTLVTSYEYDGNGNQTKVTHSDATGGDPPRVTKYAYDPHDQLASTTFADNTIETTETLKAGTEVRRKDARGTTWITYTDHQGRPIREVASGPGVDPEDPTSTLLVLETRAYDPGGRLATVRDAAGRETTYTYFGDDRVATVTARNVTQPDGTTRDIVLEQHAYDAAGNETSLTTAGGRVATTTYDNAGLPDTETLDPAGLKRATTYLRDADGQLRSVSRTGAAQPGRVESTRYVYDTAGLLTREDVEPTPGDVYSIGYVRDERGLLTQRTDRRRQTTDYAYDGHGQLVSTTMPAATMWERGQQRTGVRPVLSHGRNTFDEVTHVQDENGARSVTTYDAMGRARSTQLPDYTTPAGEVLKPVLRTDYDEVGNERKQTDPLNRETEWTYDPHGNVLTETVPKVDDQPNVTSYSYNRVGEQLSSIDRLGATTLATYDELGRQLSATEVERKPSLTYYVTRFEYDDAGNRKAVVTPGNHATRTTFNAAGEQRVVTDATGRPLTYDYDLVGRVASVTDAAGVRTTSTYDLLGRQTEVTQTGGNPVKTRKTLRGYDPNGNLVKETSPEGRIKSWGYDALDRAIRQDEQVSATKTIRVTFGYDPAGHQTRYVDGKQNATDYVYNALSLPEATIEPATTAHPSLADRTFTTTYDAAGQVRRRESPGGVVQTSTFDAQGRLRTESGTGAEAATTSRTFGYDAAGRVTSFGTPGGTTTLSYDDRSNLLTQAGPSGAASFAYTNEELLKSRTDATGTSTFEYDEAGRLKTVADGLSGRTIDQTYDTAGRLATTTERGMTYVSRTKSYDAFGRESADKLVERSPSGGEPRTIVGTEYGYDNDGNLTAKKSIAESVASANTYRYDGANRLESWTAPDGKVTGYEWDDAGNRVRAGETASTYNERNAQLTDGATTFTYAARGTMATSSEGGATTNVRFDAFDRKVANGAVGYAYDSLDRVAARGSSTFSYAGFENDVVSDGSRLTSRAPDGSPVADKAVGATTTAKLLYSDQHGDVTARYRGLDSFGQRGYDPFGAVLSSTGETPSVGYQGEWTDPENGAVNMHSRWYQPPSGGFTSRDTWNVPATPTSAAANRYSYANNSPLNHTDPSGHVVWFLAALAVHVVVDWAVHEYLAPGVAHAPGSTSRWQCTYRQCPNYTAPGVKCVVVGASRCYEPSVGGSSFSSGSGGGRGNGGRPNRPGGGGGRGPGKVRVVPPPPPPPLWVVNLTQAPPRPGPGTTTTDRPDYDYTDPGTTIDRSGDYANGQRNTTGSDTFVTLSAILMLVQNIAETAQLPPDQARVLMYETEACLKGDGPTSTTYWDLDDKGRATGADACLDKSSLLPGANKLKPYKADDKISLVGETTGCSKEDEQDPSKLCFTQKAHLIAATFKGMGDRAENLVPMTGRANRYMYNQFERCVYDRIATTGERMMVMSVPIYNGSQLAPVGVQMTAVGASGYSRTITVLNQNYSRGQLTTYCDN